MNRKDLFLSAENLTGLTADLLAAGVPVIGPGRDAAGRTDYRRLKAASDLALDAGIPGTSLKSAFFPITEPVVRWKLHRQDVVLDEVPVAFPPFVVLGARPCDAAALPVLDKVMNWDFHDELWNGRREAATVISLACDGGDAACFCEAVHLGPAAERGADILLLPVQGGYAARLLTPKGEAFAAAHSKRFAEPLDPKSLESALKPAAQKPAFTPADVRTWLKTHFEHPYWQTIALRCHGCGTCASLCPTCHCFDIVDEVDGYTAGERRRNWDTCQTAKFTVHGSGHNPRENQNPRFRQRVMHKFMIYPEKFDEILCTGCGRCIRACPSGMNISEILADLEALARQDAPAGGK